MRTSARRLPGLLGRAPSRRRTSRTGSAHGAGLPGLLGRAPSRHVTDVGARGRQRWSSRPPRPGSVAAAGVLRGDDARSASLPGLLGRAPCGNYFGGANAVTAGVFPASSAGLRRGWSGVVPRARAISVFPASSAGLRRGSGRAARADAGRVTSSRPPRPGSVAAASSTARDPARRASLPGLLGRAPSRRVMSVRMLAFSAGLPGLLGRAPSRPRVRPRGIRHGGRVFPASSAGLRRGAVMSVRMLAFSAGLPGLLGRAPSRPVPVGTLRRWAHGLPGLLGRAP